MKNKFAQQWLDILCRMIPETHSAILMAAQADTKNLRPLAKWPDSLKDFSGFTPIFKYVLKKNEQVIIPNVLQPDQFYYDFFALPVFIKSSLLGIIVLKMAHGPAEQHQAVFKALQQSVQWWELAYQKHDQSDDFYVTVANLMAAVLNKTAITRY